MKRSTLWLPFLLALFACPGVIVNEDYAVFNRESINGVDGFYGLLEADGRKLVRSPYLTRKIMETADVIVYFSTGPEDAQDLARLESWLHEIPYRPPAEAEVIDPAEARRSPRRERNPLVPALQESADDSVNDGLTEDPDADETDEQSDEEEYEDEDEDLEDELAEELLPPERELPLTLLYFLRDTSASVQFWDSLRRQMQGNEREEQFARQGLEVRIEERELFPDHREILFGTRKMLDRAGRPLNDIWVHPLLHGGGVPDFPVRYVPDPPLSYYEDVDLSFRTLMETRQGYDLVREFFVQQGRVIVSYNSEWVLNYSLVRKPYRSLAAAYIEYALAQHASSDPIKIYWITRSLRPALEAQEEEESIFRIFQIFPLNVVLIQVVFLLVLFLLSRWPHEKRPGQETRRGKREFIEHVRFLGMKLRRSKNPFDALEPLGAYVKRNRYDPDRWEAAIAGLFARGGRKDSPAESDGPENNTPQQDRNS